jgi:phage terminase small subunit
MAKKNAQLSLKERRFIDAYLGSCHGNGTEAVLAAGYNQSRKAASITAARLLGKASIRQQVNARQNARTASEIADADERDRVLTEILRKAGVPALVRISAVKELNKCTGRHSMRHLHEGKLTLEQALAASRKPRP